MTLHARGRQIPVAARPLIMGIVNVTDDSFSGDGTLDPEAAWGIAAAQTAHGADIIDVGAESAGTRRAAIPAAEETWRLLRFLAVWNDRRDALTPRFPDQVWPPVLSINTWRPEVVEAVLPVGGELLNDIGGLPDDRNPRLCAQTGTALLIMHSVGAPKVPHTHLTYPDVWEAVETFFREKIAVAESAGLRRNQLVLDPGLDFAKQRPDNLRLCADLDRLRAFHLPILLPVSRKTVIGEVLGIGLPSGRDAGTIACLVAGQLRGASIFRVHHVRAAAEAVRVVAACSSGTVGR
jgi:dihydropteroate synthase